MVHRTPNGFEQLIISLHKAFLYLCVYSIVLYYFHSKCLCSHYEIYMESFGFCNPHTHFMERRFKYIICPIAQSGNTNITATYELKRRAWCSYATLSIICSVIIPFRNSRAFLHVQADKGTQRPEYGSNLCRFCIVDAEVIGGFGHHD